MATKSELQAAERDMRDLLRRNDLPQPDEVQHWEGSICLLWHDSKSAVIIDVDEPA